MRSQEKTADNETRKKEKEDLKKLGAEIIFLDMQKSKVLHDQRKNMKNGKRGNMVKISGRKSLQAGQTFA